MYRFGPVGWCRCDPMLITPRAIVMSARRRTRSTVPLQVADASS